jgi:hypothetical protein
MIRVARQFLIVFNKVRAFSTHSVRSSLWMKFTKKAFSFEQSARKKTGGDVLSSYG